MPITSNQLKKILKEKRKNESIYAATRRLAAQSGEDLTPTRKYPKRMIPASPVRQNLNKYNYQLGAGVVSTLETLLQTTLDAAIAAARLNGRKTIHPQDITGDSVRFGS